MIAVEGLAGSSRSRPFGHGTTLFKVATLTLSQHIIETLLSALDPDSNLVYIS